MKIQNIIIGSLLFAALFGFNSANAQDDLLDLLGD
jgi:hypothetical protein